MRVIFGYRLAARARQINDVTMAKLLIVAFSAALSGAYFLFVVLMAG